MVAQTVPTDDPRLRQVAEDLGQGVALVTVDGLVLGMTEPAIRAFGHTTLPASVLLTDLCVPEEAACVTRAIQHACRRSTEATADVRIIGASGARRWLRLGVTNRLHDVAVRRVVITVRDVTDATAPWHRLRDYADHALTGRLFAAQERELTRVAHEIEDNFRQVLAVMRYNVGSMHALIDTIRHETGREQATTRTTDQVVAPLNDSVRTMQRLIDGMQEAAAGLQRGLRPPALDDLGLGPALQAYCADIDAPALRIVFQSEVPDGRRFRPDVELCAYRIVHELLSTIPQNAPQASASVSIALQDQTLRVAVTQSGTDLNVAGPADRSLLVMLQERADAAGGSVTREARNDGQVRFVVELPGDEERSQRP